MFLRMPEEHHNWVMFKSFCLENERELERKLEKAFFHMAGDKKMLSCSSIFFRRHAILGRVGFECSPAPRTHEAFDRGNGKVTVIFHLFPYATAEWTL